jgi:hypothetical protein
MIDEVATRYDFRRRRWNESLPAYRHALIEHVEARDFAAAHELRIGRAQADWTPEDVAAFHARITSLPGARREFDPDRPFALRVMMDPGPYATTDESLLALARRVVDLHCDKRVAQPREELPIVAGVLMQSGEVAYTFVDRGERIAVLRALARTQPVYGFLLAFDAFVHMIDTATKRATKRDAILCQVGTREMRRTLQRIYRVEDDRAIFDPTSPDIEGSDLRNGVDPYADIFVSVPPPTGAPS